jgi:hypothetical protein
MFGVPAGSLVFLLMIALVTIGGLWNERVPAKRGPGPTRGDPKASPVTTSATIRCRMRPRVRPMRRHWTVR